LSGLFETNDIYFEVLSELNEADLEKSPNLKAAVSAAPATSVIPECELVKFACARS
jgi:hypothetical protein